MQDKMKQNTIVERMITPRLEEDLIGIVHGCKKFKNLWQSKAFHCYLLEQDIELHPIYGNYLVSILADCGSVHDAHHVFNRLKLRNDHSWTSLILAYISCGNPYCALCLYQQMQDTRDPVQLEVHTYLALLNAYAQLKDMESSYHLHAEIVKRGIELSILLDSPAVGNTLVGTYGKCCSLMEAMHVFHRLCLHDVVSWNTLICGLGEYGQIRQAITCFERMQQGDVSPNLITHICIFKARAAAAGLETGQQMHTELSKRGWNRELHAGSALVDMYTKCGMLEDAAKIVDTFAVPNDVLLNALIAGYAEFGLSEEAIKCFWDMQCRGVSPDQLTLSFCLKACNTRGTFQPGHELHTEVVKRSFEGDLRLANALVEMYIYCQSHVEAQILFDQMPVRDVVSWDVLMAGYVDAGFGNKVMNCFEQMLLEGISPNSYIYVHTLKPCVIIEDLETGLEMHDEIITRGLQEEVHVGGVLVDMYAKSGWLREAQQVFNQLPNRNAFLWNPLIGGYAEHGFGMEARMCFHKMQLELIPNVITFLCILKASNAPRALETCREVHCEIIKLGFDKEVYVGNALIDAYSKCGSLAEAWKLFDKLPILDVVSSASLVAGYAEHGLDEKVIDCFMQMQRVGIAPDTITLVLCLKSCSAVGSLEIGHQMHSQASKSGLEQDLCVATMLITLYGKCGAICEGKAVFDKLSFKSASSWNTLVNIFGYNHRGDMAMHCFEDMQDEGAGPDSTTFKCLLALCSRASFVSEGQKYFKLMREIHGVEPILDHYLHVADLCARSGQLCEAERFTATIKCPPCESICLSLLSACGMYGEVEVGQRWFQEIVG